MTKITVKQSVPAVKPHRKDRERLVLLGLIELYIKTGKPVGSQTLKEHGFEGLSSATIRNYFSKLEQNGMLEQQHSSGGRIPTALGFRSYADFHADANQISLSDRNLLKNSLLIETKEIRRYMEQTAELLSELTGCAVFLSMPRFDQDFVVDVKLVEVDASRCLAVLVTEFGIVHTELLHTSKKIGTHALKRIEAFFHFRMTGQDKPKLSLDEEEMALRFYKEVMLRHVVRTASFSHADLYKTGFSKLLRYPEFHSSTALASGLSLFEDEEAMEKLLECCHELRFWIGDGSMEDCAAIICPYAVQNRRVGAIGLLGPMRIPYPKLFALLRATSELITEGLTRNLYKFKITFRQPGENLLLEDKRGDSE
ncbi:MAG TPA: heat-inducible transcriptional repressor HrcA [Chlamydiales bacterium]|nr:heat-inducible transcriptional repressor HrcA [Chlamydiales bacterium]HPE84730.1 heat-inducible transcriptional repressor HrcA [Chlamydiales bacterium]